MSTECVITLGTFDGVHRGHRAILARARHMAGRLGAKVVVLAFDPHPARVLRPEHEPKWLIGGDEKVQLLRACGADDVRLLQPTPQLLAQIPQEYIASLLKQMNIRAIVEGADFRFGKDRLGDIALLRTLADRFGFDISIVDPVDIVLTNQLMVPVSSSLIRWLLAHGRAFDAACCLGRPYSINGIVIAGAKRGRTLGFPTANLDTAALNGQLIPAPGVYVGRVRLDCGEIIPAAINMGAKPTFDDAAGTIEAHLLDFHRDLYGSHITIELVRWLRDQRRYPNIAMLRAQLRRDIRYARWLHQIGILKPDAQPVRCAASN